MLNAGEAFTASTVAVAICELLRSIGGATAFAIYAFVVVALSVNSKCLFCRLPSYIHLYVCMYVHPTAHPFRSSHSARTPTTGDQLNTYVCN